MILLKRNDNCWLLKSKVYISRKKILEINRLAKSSFLNPWIEKKIIPHVYVYIRMCCQSVVWIQSAILRYKLVLVPEGYGPFIKTPHVFTNEYIYLDSRLDHSGLLIGLGLIWTHSMWTQSGFARLLQINVGVTLIL